MKYSVRIARNANDYESCVDEHFFSNLADAENFYKHQINDIDIMGGDEYCMDGKPRVSLLKRHSFISTYAR